MMVPPFDILAEHGKCQGLTEPHLDRFREQGVPSGALIKSALGGWSMLARDRVVFVNNSRFEFGRHARDGESVGAFIWPAHDEFGDVVDLIAWRPPAALATWLGRIGMAGEDLISAARFGEPLLVHDDVLSWLRAAREGVVTVDPLRAVPLLRQAGRLAVGTVAQRRKLEALLTVRAPRIEVISAQVAPIERSKREPGRPEKVETETLYNVQDYADDLVDNIKEVAL